jgi:hypothetical protein
MQCAATTASTLTRRPSFLALFSFSDVTQLDGGKQRVLERIYGRHSATQSRGLTASMRRAGLRGIDCQEGGTK